MGWPEYPTRGVKKAPLCGPFLSLAMNWSPAEGCWWINENPIKEDFWIEFWTVILRLWRLGSSISLKVKHQILAESCLKQILQHLWNVLSSTVVLKLRCAWCSLLNLISIDAWASTLDSGSLALGWVPDRLHTRRRFISAKIKDILHQWLEWAVAGIGGVPSLPFLLHSFQVPGSLWLSIATSAFA